MITLNVCQDAEQLDYMVVELFHCNLRRAILWHKSENTILEEPIHHNHDSIKTFYIREGTMKSIEINTQGFFGIGKGCNNLALVCHSTLSY